MEKLILKKTSRTPAVNFDPDLGIFEIRGKSIPENSTGFFGPLLEYVEKYAAEPAEITVLNVKFDFFNTSSI